MNETVRTINNLRLYEISMVMYPANPLCTITVVDGGSGEVHSDSEVV